MPGRCINGKVCRRQCATKARSHDRNRRRNVSNLLRHLSREISVVHRSYVNICHLIAVHNDRLAMVLATLYMEPLGPCFHEANGDATAALVASLPR